MTRSLLRKARNALDAGLFLMSHRPLLQRNRRFRDRHRGERCFILCNGPSVLTQELLPLREEVVMSVSSGYLHKDFPQIKPRYHLVPAISPGTLSPGVVVRWFQEMDGKLGEAELFLASREHALVQKHALFPTRTVNYLCLARPFFRREKSIVDLSGAMPAVASVPIMGLMVALYMGFRDIYLLGTDHDSLATGSYRYSFEPTVLRGQDFSADEKGRVRAPMYNELRAYVLLWTQYRHVKRIAEANGRRIWNATAGGLLDEFPRVALETILARRAGNGAKIGRP